MARKQVSKSSDNRSETVRHPLLVYRNLGRRYRSPGVLLVLMGLFLFLPSFIRELENEAVEPEALAGVGGVLVLVGIAFLLFAHLAFRRAYIQCRPDLIVLRTPFYRVLISYRRVSHVRSVQVSQLFDEAKLKGMGKPLMLPLMKLTAVEMVVRSWPGSRRRMKLFLSKYLFSPREEAWVFIVPNYGRLMNQIDATMQDRRSRESQRSDRYEDPFERLKYYN